MAELTIIPAGVIQIGSGEAERPVRRQMLDLLSNNLPNITDTIAKCSPGQTFRAVVSGGNAHLFHVSASGVGDAMIRGANGQFTAPVHYVLAAPNVLALAPNAVMFVAMQAVAARLALIDAKLDAVGHMMIDGQHGRLKGAVNALATAGRLSGAEDRRRATLQACATVEIEVLATAGLLKAQIGAMPAETTGRFEGLFGTGFAKAKRAFEPVCETVAAIGHGTAALLEAYATLEEAAAGQFALGQIVEGVRAAGVADAIRKARLLPAVEGRAPEAGLVMLSKAVECVGACLLGSAEALCLTMDLQVEELGLV